MPVQPLHDERRRMLLGVAAVLCAIPACLAPLAGRSSLEVREGQVLHARFALHDAAASPRNGDVALQRDPFVGDASPKPVTQGQPAGTFGVPSVSAIVAGASPRALVDDAGRVRVVGVGDAISGSRVTAIDSNGVRLQNGMLLPLAKDRL